jgi:hypothetical protein
MTTRKARATATATATATARATATATAKADSFAALRNDRQKDGNRKSNG